MAAITVAKKEVTAPGGRKYIQFSGASTNSTDSFTTETVPVKATWRVVSINVTYTASSTYTGSGLTASIDDVLGAGYDKVLSSGSDNGQYFQYAPTADIRLFPGSALVLAIPAGGSGKTASVDVTVLQE